MTSRERLLTVLRGDIPDRVPVSCYELNAHNPDHFENQEPSYRRLMQAIAEYADEMSMVDFRFKPAPADEPDDIETQTWTDANGSRFSRQVWHTPKGDLTRLLRVDPNVHTVWQLEHWCKDVADLERFLSVPRRRRIIDGDHLLAKQRELGDRGILLISLADPLCVAADLFSMEDYTVVAFTEPQRFRHLLDVLFEPILDELRQVLATGIRDCLFRVVGAEYATPPFAPPQAFQEFVVPYDLQMNRLIRASGNYSRLHCHGRIREVLGMIAAAEPDALDPCEPPNQGDIELDEVKACVGDRITLMGNVELRDLEGGTPEQVRRIVQRCMEQAKAGGRYVLMPTAAPINVPLSPRTEANYLAYLDAGREYGGY